MTGTYSATESWEKQSVWDLENGWQATVGDSFPYGLHMVCRLDCPAGMKLAHGKPYWHCSDGLAELPDFARPWLEEIRNDHGIIASLVRPRWEKQWPKS